MTLTCTFICITVNILDYLSPICIDMNNIIDILISDFILYYYKANVFLRQILLYLLNLVDLTTCHLNI